MEPINITFLGTGNAVPTKLRNHSAILIQYKDEQMLFDCGEGTQRQYRYAHLSPNKLTRLFITHWHGDHTLGIPGLLQTLAMSDYSKTLHIYGPSGTKNYMQTMEKLMGKFKIKLQIHESKSGSLIETNEWKVISEQADHDTPALAYSFIIKDKIRLDKKKIQKLKLPNSPLLAKLQSGQDILFNGKKIKAKDTTYSEPGRKVTIILDTRPSAKLIALAKNSSLAIIESSFAEKEKDKAHEYFHLTAKQAAQIAKQSKSTALILTHISQRYEHTPFIIEKEAKTVFKNTNLVKDLDTIVL